MLSLLVYPHFLPCSDVLGGNNPREKVHLTPDLQILEGLFIGKFILLFLF